MLCGEYLFRHSLLDHPRENRGQPLDRGNHQLFMEYRVGRRIDSDCLLPVTMEKIHPG